jgi:hypothetical protein
MDTLPPSVSGSLSNGIGGIPTNSLKNATHATRVSLSLSDPNHQQLNQQLRQQHQPLTPQQQLSKQLNQVSQHSQVSQQNQNQLSAQQLDADMGMGSLVEGGMEGSMERGMEGGMGSDNEEDDGHEGAVQDIHLAMDYHGE